MKLGRKPRAFNSSVPNMKALKGGLSLDPLPEEIHNTTGMPSNFGMMLNDRLGDCTCAAYYHARQIWSFEAGKFEITNPDNDVLGLYEKACGYNPSDPTSDNGGVEQEILTYLLNSGAPGCEPIIAFVEIEATNLIDIRRSIYENGCAYIGVDLPQSAMSSDLWDVVPNDPIAGGHAIILTGYDAEGFDLISWGKLYRCTIPFIEKYCDEAYAIADRTWIEATGLTPLGLTIAELESIMQALKNENT